MRLKEITALATVTAFLTAAGPASQPTTLPSGLVGKWQIVSMGPKKVPPEIELWWTITNSKVVVSSKEAVFTTSAAQVRKVDGQDVLFLTTDDKSPRAVIWKITGDELRLMTSLDASKPPTKWVDDEVILLRRVTE